MICVILQAVTLLEWHLKSDSAAICIEKCQLMRLLAELLSIRASKSSILIYCSVGYDQCYL